jgi:hypothetical protein
MVCFVDELGDELSKVKNQSGNVWLTAIIGLLKKSYNAWGRIITAEKVGEESERIEWPAPSIIGAATPERFFESLEPSDLESGFANRLLILPFEGSRRPPEQSPANGPPPKQLVDDLRKLLKHYQPPKEDPLNLLVDGPIQVEPQRIEWGPGAADAYLQFSRKMDDLQELDPRRYELGMRACENAARLATIVAIGRASPTVDKEDIDWAIALASQSVDAACGGVAKYMRENFEFPKFCDKVLEFIASEGGWAAKREIERKFRTNARNGFEIKNALEQLKREERIVERSRSAARGPSAQGYQIVGDQAE